jgi:glycosyltransferase involved in cell wall biosynthesis
MKILFDCRYTRITRHDGISRFTAGLVTALAKLHPVTMMINDTRQLELLPDLPWVMGPSPTAITEPLAALYFNRYAPDVVYSPMQTMGPWGRTFGLVTTVHDLIYYSNRTPPRNLAWPVRIVWRAYHLWWGPQRGLLGRADAHVAVSETTKELMVSNRLTPHPITVIPDAVDEPESTRQAPATTRDLVYMGSFMPYKNVELLGRALHLLPGYHLHLLSRSTADDRARLERVAPPGSLTFHGGVDDAAYARALASAFALVSASRNEGFGLPVLEAMASGTPVAVSDIEVFREIAGDAAVFFNPDSPESFANAIVSLEDPNEWMQRSRQVVEQARPYRWDHSAALLLEVLTRVHNDRQERPDREGRAETEVSDRQVDPTP